MKKLLSVVISIFLITTLMGCSMAGNYYKEGKESFKDKDYEKAAEYFSKAIAKKPDRADYYVDYGLVLIALGKYEDALKQFEHAYIDKDMAIIKENNKKALRGMGIAYYNMQQYKKALEKFENALKLSVLPTINVDMLYYMGSSLKAIGSYEKAVKIYNDILSKKGKDIEAYAERAYCYRRLGLYEKSLADYDYAILLASDKFDYYFGKYYLLIEYDKTDEAKAVLAKAAELKVSTEEDKYNLAKLHYYQGNMDVAAAELEKSFQAGFYDAYYYIGEIYRNKKDYIKATYYYEKYIAEGKVITPNVYNQAAVCYMKTGDYEKALKLLETGIAYQDSSIMQVLRKNEIIVYEYMGEFKTAEDKLADYLVSYPKDKEALREADFVDTRIMDAVTTE